ncbi:SWIM zinc finger domain-containing protein [Geobacillus sp. C56-T2]|uniref:SWIM zinc finger family protein n=1 Tax=Geobacillus sp. C56-T2 TaxID=600773 RepID=UPI0011A51250|nr:SWIM zinc finger family protein [Geobacillus sp. C56-T2]NNV07876.1 SWIM zinc finger family protein [Geobacillus sp. MMMUD3]TWG31978.1 hypothetical protein GC56T2_3244 [Geobacillus sp. C56-T2]
MLQTTVSKPLLQQAASELIKEFPFSIFHHLIQKGRDLARSGLVYNVMVVNSHEVEGVVSDITPHEVMLDLTKAPRRHRCPCPTEGLCPHILALFFYVYGNVFDNGELFRLWKKGQISAAPKEPVAHESNTLAAKRTGKTASLPVVAHETVEDWWDQFERQYEDFFARQQSGANWPYRLAFQLLPKLGKNNGRQAGARPLRELHAALFLLEKLREYGEAQGWSDGGFGSYRQFSWHQDVNYVAGRALAALEAFSTQSPPRSLNALVEQTILYVRDGLFWEGELASFGYDLYTTAWETLFTKPAWRQEERAELLQLAKSQDNIRAAMAAAHLSFLLGEDDEAIALYRAFPDQAGVFLAEWFGRFIQNGLLKRFEAVWEKIKHDWPLYLSHIPAFVRSSFLEETAHWFEMYARHRNRPGAWEEFLQRSLPYSVNEYTHFLYKQRRDQELVDLFLWANITADELPPPMLKTLQARGTELVMPLYHRTVVKLLNEKNRSSYQKAVRYLKTLRAQYRSTKRLDQWEAYLEQLLAQTARLRAFHEELKKGKLLP